MRLQGWTERLNAALLSARDKPYVLGVHDCTSFACEVVNGITGKDFWPLFSGAYSTTEEAVALIKRIGLSFEATVDKITAFERIDWKFAQRGDLVMFETEDKFKHLGICIGEYFAGLNESGLQYIKMKAVSAAWRVE